MWCVLGRVRRDKSDFRSWWLKEVDAGHRMFGLEYDWRRPTAGLLAFIMSMEGNWVFAYQTIRLNSDDLTALSSVIDSDTRL